MASMEGLTLGVFIDAANLYVYTGRVIPKRQTINKTLIRLKNIDM
jgi:hypothetical protein